MQLKTPRINAVKPVPRSMRKLIHQSTDNIMKKRLDQFCFSLILLLAMTAICADSVSAKSILFVASKTTSNWGALRSFVDDTVRANLESTDTANPHRDQTGRWQVG